MKSRVAEISTSRMQLKTCALPQTTAIEKNILDNAYFVEAYRFPLRQRSSVIDIYFAIFGHRPLWMKIPMILRNAAARLCGLEAPTTREILKPQIKASYAVGEKIGAWPIFVLNQNELVAGRDNSHLDFRLSVLITEGQSEAVISTLCRVHNIFGKLYLASVIPLHKWGFRRLILRALQDGRL